MWFGFMECKYFLAIKGFIPSQQILLRGDKRTKMYFLKKARKRSFLSGLECIF